MQTKEFSWCKDCGEPCISNSKTCELCEEEMQMRISKYEESKRRFSKFDLVEKVVST